MSDVFISYSRQDATFVRRVQDALEARGKKVWVDWQDIPPSAEWMAEIHAAIENADAFAFVISPDSIASETCGKELAHALEHNKRILPLALDPPETHLLPDALARLNWVIFSNEEEFGTSIDKLVEAADTDLVWVRQHTRLTTRAVEWESHDKDPSFVLRGGDLQSAEQGLSQAQDKDPQPTALQTRYIVASRRAATRRQRLITGASVTALAISIVLGSVAVVQRNDAAAARDEANAGRLLALGRLQLEGNPSGAVAYALASLEVADNDEARRFAVEALWRGPSASVLDNDAWYIDFSPDGQWLVVPRTGGGTGIDLWSQNGEAPRSLEISYEGRHGFQPWSRIGPDSDLLVTGFGGRRRVIEFWSFPEGELLRTQEVDGLFSWDLLADGKRLWTVSGDGNQWLAHSWPLAGGEPTLLGRIEKEPGHKNELGSIDGPRVDPTGTWFFSLVSEDGSVSLRRLDGTGPTVALSHEERIDGAWFSPEGGRLATADESGEMRIWSFNRRSEPTLLRILSGHRGPVLHAAFGPEGRKLSSASLDTTARIWDLEAPPEADPIVLKLNLPQFGAVAFHPTGSWLATGGPTVAIWPLDRAYPRVFHTTGKPYGVAFAPDGSWVASGSTRGLRVWPLKANTSRMLLEGGLLNLDVDREGRHLLAGGSGDFGTWLVPLDESEPRRLEGFREQAWYVALSPDGRRAAAAGGQFFPEEGFIRIWDLESGEVQILDPGERKWIAYLHFTPEGRLISGGRGGVRIWDLDQETFETMREGEAGEDPFFSVSLGPEGRFLASVPVVALSGPLSSEPVIQVQDLSLGTTWEVTSHGNQVNALAIDPSSATLVTVDRQQVVRAGPLSGEDPHLLLGHESGRVWAVALSPDGRVIASVGDDETLRLWPMPEGQPLHTLAHEDLLQRLRALTNLRAIQDPEAEGGYRLEVDPFPGWETAPIW